jgi:hypothetical protein
LNTAVTNSINTGVTYVASAGNSASDASGYSPASVPDVITVAAITGNDAQTTYTNVGSCVDLYAPGTQIYSATNTDDYAYTLDTGTSQASAFVAGAAALYLETNPGASPAQVAQAIISGSTGGVVTGVTGGTPNRLLRVNGSGSLTPPPTTNNPPVASFTASCQKAKCSFNASASNDDSGIVSYAWKFGDGTGTTSSSPLASHIYAAKGTYSETVTLVVTDAGGLTSTASKTLSIKAGR